MHISPIQEILSDFKLGRFVILIDDETRENEGDLIVAAQFATPDKINFLTRQAGGLMYLALSSEHNERLKLPMIKSETHSSGRHHAAFTYSIEASKGVGSGISVSDRARTVKVAISHEATHEDIVCPGHVFPILARDGGVLERAGHTEAAVDLSRLCGLNPSAVACEILDENGACANRAYLSVFSKRFNIKIGTVADLIEFRKSGQVST